MPFLRPKMDFWGVHLGPIQITLRGYLIPPLNKVYQGRGDLNIPERYLNGRGGAPKSPFLGLKNGIFRISCFGALLRVGGVASQKVFRLDTFISATDPHPS